MTLSLDDILKKTVIKKVKENQMINDLKEFHNKIGDKERDFSTELFYDKMNDDPQFDGYIQIKNDFFDFLEINMFIKFIKKNDDGDANEGKIINITINNKNAEIELYHFGIEMTFKINTKNYDIYIYEKDIKVDNKLEKYYYVEDIKYLQENDWIKYINKKNRDKLSCAGQIKKINSNIHGKITHIELYNFYKNIKWKIKTNNYYIFKYDLYEKEINEMSKDSELKNIFKKISNEFNI